MKRYFTNTPHFFIRIFSNLTWCFVSDKKQVYLTFDDGPTPFVTEFVLSELKKYNAKATFFCIGKNIEKYPEIFKQIINENHSIGNHTYNHINGWKTDTETYIKNIKKTGNIINLNLKTQNSKLFRPPYGKIKFSQVKKLKKLGYQIIMWDVLSADFDTSINSEKCLDNVLKNTKKGSIVVFHDSIKAQEKAYNVLPKILNYYSKKGFEFKAI